MRNSDKAYLYSDTSISKEDIESMKVKSNYLSEVKKNTLSIISFDFGKTESGENVVSHIFLKLIPTLQIAILSILFGSIFGVLFSIFSMYFSPIENIISFIAKSILSTPIFIISILLFLLFFYKLGILPPGGYKNFGIEYLVMPSIALGSRVACRIYFFSLNELQKEIKSDFVFFFNALGFSKARIYFYYLPRKILPIILILLILDFCSLLTGSIIVEEFFFFPGIGKSMLYAAKSLDKNLLLGMLFYTGIIFYTFTRISKKLQNKLLTQE